jgi:hypothetical protein
MDEQNIEVGVRVCFMEIYNETIKDLLQTDHSESLQI